MIIHIVIIIIDGNLFIMGLGHPRQLFGKTPEPSVPDDRDTLLLGQHRGRWLSVSLPLFSSYDSAECNFFSPSFLLTILFISHYKTNIRLLWKI